MSVQAEKVPMTTNAQFEPARVNVRIKISALWTAMLFVFVYVDLFSLYRADIRADIEAGKLSAFTINQTFLLWTTAYIVIPALMLFGALVLRPAISRIANVALSAVYALSIIAGAIGDPNYYYLLGSALEIALLATIAYYAWTWPRISSLDPQELAGGTADHSHHAAA